MISEYFSDLVVRYRRWRLLRAYSRVFKRRTGKSVGLTPMMAAWSYAERDGLLTLHENGEIEWHWPEGSGSNDSRMSD